MQDAVAALDEPGFYELRDRTGLAELWWLPPERSYTLGQPLGRGTYGSVCAAERHGAPCVVKRVALLAPNKMLSGGKMDQWAQTALRRTLRELGILSRLRPLELGAIVQLLDAWTDADALRGMRIAGPSRTRKPIPALYLSFERLQRHHHLHGPPGEDGPSMTDVARIMHGVLQGLCSLHSNRLLHRDLKPDNIMFSAGGCVRIIDFGMAWAQQPPHLYLLPPPLHGTLLCPRRRPWGNPLLRPMATAKQVALRRRRRKAKSLSRPSWRWRRRRRWRWRW